MTHDATTVKTLIGDNKILADETPWQALIGKINDYLSYRLFESDGGKESIGLLLGFYQESSNGSPSFYANFEVVEDGNPPS